jgi:hypothetical protein
MLGRMDHRLRRLHEQSLRGAAGIGEDSGSVVKLVKTFVVGGDCDDVDHAAKL